MPANSCPPASLIHAKTFQDAEAVWQQAACVLAALAESRMNTNQDQDASQPRLCASGCGFFGCALRPPARSLGGRRARARRQAARGVTILDTRRRGPARPGFGQGLGRRGRQGRLPVRLGPT